MHSPSTNTPPAEPIASALGLLPGLIGAVVVGVASGIGFAAIGGWAPGEGRMDVGPSAMLGGGTVMVGVILGLMLLWPAGNRTPAKLGLMVLASGATRLIASAGMATAVVVVSKPEPKSFFTSLCAAFVLCLIVESLWATAALKRVFPRATPTQATAVDAAAGVSAR